MAFRFGPGCWEVVTASLALLHGCEPANRPVRGRLPQSSSAPTDSLAFSVGNGIEVWYTLSRAATAPAGSTCVERGLQIRRNGKRIQVPLLYTGDTPILINDSTIRATLWTNCRPVAPYLVDLRSGRPVPESRGMSQ